MVDSEDRVDKPENFDDQIMQDAKSNLDEVMDKPCKVDKVFISGVKRTKDYILQRELESLKQAQTLQEVHDCLSEAHDRLMALEIFDAVQMTIDESPKVRYIPRMSHITTMISVLLDIVGRIIVYHHHNRTVFHLL